MTEMMIIGLRGGMCSYELTPKMLRKYNKAMKKMQENQKIIFEIISEIKSEKGTQI